MDVVPALRAGEPNGRLGANGFRCPQARCDGGPLDAWTWGRVREGNPNLPETPEEGGYYSHFSG